MFESVYECGKPLDDDVDDDEFKFKLFTGNELPLKTDVLVDSSIVLLKKLCCRAKYGVIRVFGS